MLSFRGRENFFFSWHKKTLNFVDNIVDKGVGKNFEKDEVFVKYYKQYLRYRVAGELRPLVQSDKLYDDLSWNSGQFNGRGVRQLSRKRYMRSIMLRGYVIYYIFLLLVRGKVRFQQFVKQECRVLILPYHKNWVNDPELHYLLTNVSDAKVVLSNGDRLVDSLDVNQVVKDKQTYLNISDLKEILGSLYWTIRGLFSRKELYDAAAWYLYKKIYYMSLLNIVNPSMVAVVRGDMSQFSSIIRQVSNNKNIPVFSWSHSVYYYPEYYLAGVDYDYFSASAPFELDLYENYWCSNCIYTYTGQMAYPSVDGVLNDGIDLQYFDGFNGVFSTSIDSRVLPNTLQNYSEFVDAVVLSSKSIAGGFFYKSKNNYKTQRGENIVNEAKQAEEYALSQFSFIGDEFVIIEDGVTVKDISKFINIAFVYSMSTVAFELIQENVKVVVFWPFDSDPHPFSSILPLLVAKDANEMAKNAMLLDEMSSLDYIKYLQPYFDRLSFSMSDERSMLLQAIDSALEDTNKKDCVVG